MSKNYKEHIEIVANESLEIFSKIAEAARSGLDDVRVQSQYGDFANQNEFMLEKAKRNKRKVTEAVIRSYHKLIREPAVARVVAKKETGEKITYYICRETPEAIDCVANIRLVSYRAAAGRLASLPIGGECSFGDKKISNQVLENAKFSPILDSGEWDSKPAILESEICKLVTVESLREFLRDKEKTDKSDISRLDELLEEELKSKNIIDGIRPAVREKMELRDQATLDQYQDELFRLPIDSRILLLGAPGTGKTTTLIRRLGQKLYTEFLNDDERKVVGIEDEDPVAENNHSQSWIMFTPTELLKLYVKEAFNREGIPAPDERISTWDEFRIDLARNRFGVLRSASGRGPYVMKDSAPILESGTKTDLIAWFADFDKWQKAVFLNAMRAHAMNLCEHSSSEISLLGKKLLAIFGTDEAELQPGMFVSLLMTTKEIQELVKDIKESSDKKIRGALNLQVNKDADFLDNFASFIESLPEEKDSSEEQDTDVDGEEEEDDELSQPRIGRIGAEIYFMRTVRSQARARARSRNVSKSSRTGRLIEWLGDRTLPDQELKEIGTSLVLQSTLRQFTNPVQRYINRIPIRYRRFRRERQAKNLWYCAEGFSPTDIHPLEVDLILLAMIRGANDLIMDAPALNTPDNPAYRIFERLHDLYRTQVVVDEATDFSPVQLSCMMALARPGIKSFFACGDFHQRVTNWGTRSAEQMEWAIPNLETREVRVLYRQSRQLHDFAKEIIGISGGDVTDAVLPKYGNNEGFSPVLATRMSEVAEIANWLSQRIQEIEQTMRGLPSIAVFVNSEEEVSSVATALKDELADQHISVIPCRDGYVRGSESAVRVFNIEHIKGLEFEAVFFVGIDKLVENRPDLFDKYLYVGATRAATYLGITCEQDLPSMMEGLRKLFGQEWRQLERISL